MSFILHRIYRYRIMLMLLTDWVDCAPCFYSRIICLNDEG